MYPILTVEGLEDKSTPILNIVTYCSKCRARVVITRFDARDDIGLLERVATASGDADGGAFLRLAGDVHGVARDELEPPRIVIS